MVSFPALILGYLMHYTCQLSLRKYRPSFGSKKVRTSRTQSPCWCIKSLDPVLLGIQRRRKTRSSERLQGQSFDSPNMSILGNWPRWRQLPLWVPQPHPRSVCTLQQAFAHWSEGQTIQRRFPDKFMNMHRCTPSLETFREWASGAALRTFCPQRDKNQLKSLHWRDRSNVIQSLLQPKSCLHRSTSMEQQGLSIRKLGNIRNLLTWHVVCCPQTKVIDKVYRNFGGIHFQLLLVEDLYELSLAWS